MEFCTQRAFRESTTNDPMLNLRIAVIDDEHIIADTLAEILKLRGYVAKAHYSGESAIADAQEFRPHVVLSDVRMENLDGIEAALRIREFQPECRMILFTASPVRKETYERISKLGFEFLARPLHPQEVLALLRDGLRLPTGADRDQRSCYMLRL